MFENRICLPEENVTYTPLKIGTPILGVFHRTACWNLCTYTVYSRCFVALCCFVWIGGGMDGLEGFGADFLLTSLVRGAGLGRPIE